MIKALMLVFMPVSTWDRIVRAQRPVAFTLITYLLPLLVITSLAEGYGLVHWGAKQKVVDYVKKFSIQEALVFAAVQVILSLVLVFVLAKIVKSLGETFHGRHTYRQTFTLVAYGFGPMFALRAFDIFPINLWITWIAGVFLCIMVLYQGIPSVMQPDPPHAFGLYLMSTFALVIASGLVRFLTVWYLQGRFKSLPVLSSIGHQWLLS